MKRLLLKTRKSTSWRQNQQSVTRLNSTLQTRMFWWTKRPLPHHKHTPTYQHLTRANIRSRLWQRAITPTCLTRALFSWTISTSWQSQPLERKVMQSFGMRWRKQRAISSLATTYQMTNLLPTYLTIQIYWKRACIISKFVLTATDRKSSLQNIAKFHQLSPNSASQPTLTTKTANSRGARLRAQLLTMCATRMKKRTTSTHSALAPIRTTQISRANLRAVTIIMSLRSATQTQCLTANQARTSPLLNKPGRPICALKATRSNGIMTLTQPMNWL